MMQYQTWKIVYTDGIKGGVTQYGKKGSMSREFGFKYMTYFYIVSKMREARVLEVVGSRLVIKKLVKNRTSQQFYFDSVSKTIKCVAYTNKSLWYNKSTKYMEFRITDSTWYQMWKFSGHYLVNYRHTDLVVSINGKSDNEGTTVKVVKKTGHTNQQWFVVYAT
jgi:hypothetical protein